MSAIPTSLSCHGDVVVPVLLVLLRLLCDEDGMVCVGVYATTDSGDRALARWAGCYKEQRENTTIESNDKTIVGTQV